jgi:hypothetical protein
MRAYGGERCPRAWRAASTRRSSTTRRTSPTRTAPTSRRRRRPRHRQVKVRRFIAVDDCGVRINPMIVEGQIHGGLAEGVGIALMEVITFDEEGNCLGGSFMDYLIPTALEARTSSSARRSRRPAPPARRQGRRRVAERRLAAGDRQRGDRRAATHGVDHIDMPCTPARVWACRGPGRACRRPTSRRCRGCCYLDEGLATSRSSASGRCCSRPASARPRRPRRWPRCSTRR